MNKYKQSEIKSACDYGGCRQPGSGNKPSPGLRGDIRVPRKYRFEQKDPQGDRYVLRIRDLDSLWVLARRASEMPVLLLISDKWGDLVIVDDDDLLEVTSYRDVLQFVQVGFIGGRKSKTLYLDRIHDMLTDDQYEDWQPTYIQIGAPSRTYALMRRHDFDQTWIHDHA